jgi:hypothetical protein
MFKKSATFLVLSFCVNFNITSLEYKPRAIISIWELAKE